MRISYDQAKRQKTLDERGLDFEGATAVFSGLTFEVKDMRQNYGETRMIRDRGHPLQLSPFTRVMILAAEPRSILG